VGKKQSEAAEARQNKVETRHKFNRGADPFGERSRKGAEPHSLGEGKLHRELSDATAELPALGERQPSLRRKESSLKSRSHRYTHGVVRHVPPHTAHVHLFKYPLRVASRPFLSLRPDSNFIIPSFPSSPGWELAGKGGKGRLHNSKDQAWQRVAPA